MVDLAPGQTPVVITGGAGMLGSALVDLAPAGVQALGVDLPDGDLSQLEGARLALAAHRPQVVIHCAAYTDVDGCTRDPQRAFLHNATASRNVAIVCRELGARLLALSTDYVFDGTKGSPYTEQDLPNPLNPYGESKLAAERLVAQELPNHLIVRTQWLYGPGGKNFAASILARARAGGELRVVADQWGSPTYTRDLARGLWSAALSPARGIVHLTNAGVATWADFAEAALRAAGLDNLPVQRISAADWPTPTVRPRYSVLDNQRWVRLGLRPLRRWEEAVQEYVEGWMA